MKKSSPVWYGLCDLLVPLPGLDHQDISASPVAVDEPHHISSVHIANGGLLGTARADDMKTPDALMEGDPYRALVL